MATDTKTKALTIKDRLNSPDLVREIARVVPAHMKPERMVRVALTALMRTPDLAHCDQPSFFKALLDLSAWGLEPDGRHAHLIPFRNNKRNCIEVQLIIDYKGYVRLAYQSGLVASIHADVVRRGDLFVYNRGDVELHTPWFLRNDPDKPDAAGEIYAVYCRVVMKDGAVKCEPMSLADVDSIRARSKARDRGPWVTDYAEMAKKTAFRRASKWIPLSAELHEAMERDDDRLADTGATTVQQQGMSALRDQISDMLSHGQAEGGSEVDGEVIDAESQPPTQQSSVAGLSLNTLAEELAKATTLGTVADIEAKYATALTPDQQPAVAGSCDERREAIRGGRGGKKKPTEQQGDAYEEPEKQGSLV
jgi:recombination protein RecT